MTEHPELRSGRRRLYVPIKDNNARKELSAATISRWICTTIVDSLLPYGTARVFQEHSKHTRSREWLLRCNSLIG